MKKMSIEKIQGMKEGLQKAGYPVSKWLIFCETMLNRGYKVSVYCAKTTYSKYVYVHKGSKSFKVRFSNHKPNYNKEVKDPDCDFFVGVCHSQVTTTDDAIEAVNKFFGGF